MNDYQEEQWDALVKACETISGSSQAQITELQDKIRPYLEFRVQLEEFTSEHFGRLCMQSCFENHLSACCSKDGILAFWADMIINVLVSTQAQLADLTFAVRHPRYPSKCTYLGQQGCRWQVRPLMCAMFLCDPVKAKVFGEGNEAQNRWNQLQEQANGFRWPDKPVLFDWIESYGMAMGVHSSLMYINKSPGLLCIKRKAGLMDSDRKSCK